MKIQRLDEIVVRQIAAGEVVERPASVVKELLENSIDAGASKIDVAIVAAGKQKIRISDDGCGLESSEALLALERHTTSKLSDIDDLNNILTYGFRGEAMSSIASVSRLTLTTSTGETGTSIRVEGGKVQSQASIARTRGTTIEISDLFFNTPARLEFLKSDATERGRIIRVFEELALAHPHIAFSLALNNDDGAQVYPARKNRLERLIDLWGKHFGAEQMFSLDFQHPLLKLSGFSSHPQAHQATKGFQVFYVNNRPIQSRALSQALYEAYRDALPVGRHPAAVIFIDIAPSEIDVNVHPAKREVRFKSEGQIYEALVREIRFKRGQISTGILTTPQQAPQVLQDLNASARSAFTSATPRPLAFTPPSPPLQTRVAENFAAFETQREPERELLLLNSARVLGQYQHLYILFEKSGMLYLVDQHAASERYYYERLSSAYSGDIAAPSQKLLLPYLWNTTLEQAQLLSEHLEEFQKLGFDVAAFGEKTFRVTALPSTIRETELDNVLSDILLAFSEEKTPEGISHEILKRTACHAAVRAGDVLTQTEMVQILNDLERCQNPHTCPHGRPTTLVFTRQELDKKFGRDY